MTEKAIQTDIASKTTNPEQNAVAEPFWKKTLKFCLKFGISAAILIYLIHSRHITLKDFANVRIDYVILAFFCIVLQVFLTSIRWRSLLKAVGIHCTVWEAFSLQMQGAFFSLCIPGGSVGGDIIKAGLLVSRTPKDGKFNCVFSIFVDRLCGLSALLLTLLLTCLVCREEIELFEPAERHSLSVMCMICGCVFLLTVLVFFSDLLYKIPLTRFFLNLADKITKNTFRKAADAVGIYRHSWYLPVIWILAATFIFFPILGVPVWLIANGIQGAPERSLLPCLMTSNISQTIAAIPISFGGTGMRDIACTKMLEALSIGKPDSVVIPLLITLLSIFSSLTGAVFFIFSHKKKSVKTSNNEQRSDTKN